MNIHQLLIQMNAHSQPRTQKVRRKRRACDLGLLTSCPCTKQGLRCRTNTLNNGGWTQTPIHDVHSKRQPTSVRIRSIQPKSGAKPDQILRRPPTGSAPGFLGVSTSPWEVLWGSLVGRIQLLIVRIVVVWRSFHMLSSANASLNNPSKLPFSG